MLFRTSVADIIRPLSTIAEKLRKHVENQLVEIRNYTDSIAVASDKRLDCENQMKQAERLAQKLEDFLSTD